MGHSANFVVIRKNKATAYYDHWAALGCTFTFAEGPDAAEEMLDGLERTKELLDWAFAEAGWLLDHDRKVAIVFGYPMDDMDGDPAAAKVLESFAKGPKDFLKLIAPNWKGWTLIWNSRGVDAFAVYLKERKIKSIRSGKVSLPKDMDPPITHKAKGSQNAVQKGHGSNFVVIRKSKATAYFDPWAAMGCAYYFANGPEESETALGVMEKTKVLVEWSTAAGGYLLDFDDKQAIVFGNPMDDFDDVQNKIIQSHLNKSPKDFLKLIAPKWKGWRLVWDARGVDAFAEYLKRRKIYTIGYKKSSHPRKLAAPVTHQA